MKKASIWNPDVKTEVVGTVIATVVVAVLGIAWGVALRLGPSVRTGMDEAVSLALRSSNIPNWMLLIATVALVGVVIAPSVFMWRRFAARSRQRRIALGYTADVFFGIRWTWQYNGIARPIRFRPFCLTCQDSLYFESSTSHDGVKQITYRCDRCGWYHPGFKKTEAGLEAELTKLATERNPEAHTPSNSELKGVGIL